MTATLSPDVPGTQHVSSQPNNVTRRARHPVDAGNRFIKWFSATHQPQCMSSNIKYLEDWEAGIVPTDDKSVVIEAGTARFVIGQIAKELNGKTIRTSGGLRTSGRRGIGAPALLAVMQSFR